MIANKVMMGLSFILLIIISVIVVCIFVPIDFLLWLFLPEKKEHRYIVSTQLDGTPVGTGYCTLFEALYAVLKKNKDLKKAGRYKQGRVTLNFKDVWMDSRIDTIMTGRVHTYRPHTGDTVTCVLTAGSGNKMIVRGKKYHVDDVDINDNGAIAILTNGSWFSGSCFEPKAEEDVQKSV